MKALIELIVIAVIAALGYLGFEWMKANAPVLPEKVVVEHVPLVEVITAKLDTHTLVLHSEGTIQAPARLTLTPEVAGRIKQVSPALKAGAFVPAGTLLIQIDDTDARLALASAQANLAAREAAVTLEESRAEVAIADWRELNTGTPPNLVSRAPEIALAIAQRDVARTTVDQAQVQVERTRIAMPFDGRVIEEHVEVGMRVDPMTTIATFERSGPLEAHLNLELAEIGLLGLDPRGQGAEGLPIELSERVGASVRTWRAVGTRTLTNLSPNNPVVTLVANVEPGDMPPPSGLFVEAIVYGRDVEAFALPAQAVKLDGRALLMDADMRLHWFDAHPIHTVGNTTFAAEGYTLQPGDQVVTSPPAVVVEGMPVRLFSEAANQ